MHIPFEDPFPGKPRVLFIGLPHSSHTHSWIELLGDGEFNIRLFALSLTVTDWPMALAAMPDNWHIPTFIPSPVPQALNPDVYFPAHRRTWLPWRLENRITRKLMPHDERLLAHVMQTWKPHIVHTLGMEPAGFFYSDMLAKYRFPETQWVAQIRGGPELTINHRLPEPRQKIQHLLAQCDYVVADNEVNYQIIRDMGTQEKKLQLGRVPGTGGIDIDYMSGLNSQLPSQKPRTIVIPKGYEGMQSKAMPILEALKLVWNEIAPCKIYLLAVTPDINAWLTTLPEKIRDSCVPMQRVQRNTALQMIADARVMLSPSLLDGVPNVLYEAMACGTVPIVSPLETFAPLVEDKKNVLFARNLYPQEIGDALVTAMTDDSLVDAIAIENKTYIYDLADRNKIRVKVQAFYNRIAGVL